MKLNNKNVSLWNSTALITYKNITLIVPKEKLQKVLADEIKAFSEEKGNK